MKIVVDSNIVFSAILNTKGKIGQLIINGSEFFNFYSIALLKEEIMEHKAKILKITGLKEKQFEEVFQIIISRIKFIDDIVLSAEKIKEAENLVLGIDNDDTMFVALNNYLSAKLWTGDKQLIKGLKKKEYFQTITTDELHAIFLEKKLKKEKKK